jgi:glutaconate CoA-transferase subunit B
VRGGGPHAVVTDLGILTPDEETGELLLTHVHASRGATAEQAITNTGWPLKVASDLKTTAPPTQEELRLLRDELDQRNILEVRREPAFLAPGEPAGCGARMKRQ